MDTPETHDKNSVPFLIGIIVIGILMIVMAAVLLRKPVSEASPYDAPAPPPAAAPSPR